MNIKHLAVAAALMLATTAQAQEAAAVVQPKAHNQQAELVVMAGQLAKYGYETKTALPLIQAVDILNRVGVSDETEAKTKTSEGEVATTLDKKPVVSHDPAQLLADAATYAEGDKSLLALIDKAKSGTRGAVGGAKRHTDIVRAGASDTYEISFRGGEEALVIVSGDGDTDLDLYVYDENGNLIDSDTDGTDDCVCTFTPRWTGKFRIKIKNYGRVYNKYVLITN